MMFIKLLGSAALAMAAASAIAQPADFSARADSIVRAAYPSDGPGAAVIVTRGGRVIYSAGRGLADVEGRRPITADTPFRLGSIVKQFTAAVVLQLAAEGKISLDDPVSRFFPDWPEPTAGATVRQLLNHSSGIQDFSKVPGWIAANRSKSWTTAELLALFRTLPARSKPGEAWEYNNGGYVMLGAIVEKVTGKAWHEAVAERIARPLGLKTIAYAASDEALRTMARGYSEEGGRQVPLETIPVTVAHASGGLVGSVGDMARWAHALHHGRVVGPELYREMTRRARLADGTTRPYGFGLRLQQLRGRPALVHGGAGAGLDTDSAYLPSEDLFVAVFANSDSPATDPDILTWRLAALALGEPFPAFTRAEADIAAIEPLFGLYDAETGPPLRFFARGGKLFLGMGEGELEAFPAGDDRFFFGPDRLIWIRFERRPGGAHVVLVNRPDSAQPLRAVRSGAAPAAFTVAPAVLQTYVGTYQTEALAVTIALRADGSLTITPAGQRPMPMRPVSDTEFRIDGTPMRLVFHPENGRVDRLTLYRGARELHGRRSGP
jgi:CubicO group peptidase (beta-lactamase class C family)